MRENTCITSAFLDELWKNGVIDDLFHLNLSKTEVCGHIFDLIRQKRIHFQLFIPDIQIDQLEQTFVQIKEAQKNDEKILNLIEKDQIKKRNRRFFEKQMRYQEGISKLLVQLNQIIKQYQTVYDEQKANDILQSQLEDISNEQIQEDLNNPLQLCFMDISFCKSIQPIKFNKLFSLNLQSLTFLKLKACNIFNENLGLLIENLPKNFSNLQYINISCTPIQTQKVKLYQILSAKKMVEVHLDSTDFGEESVKQFGEEKLNLYNLSIYDCLFHQDSQLISLMRRMDALFDVNELLQSYKYLITLKMFNYMLRENESTPLLSVLNLKDAPLTLEVNSIDSIIGKFKHRSNKSLLEYVILDNSNISFKQVKRLLSLYQSITHISAANTPFLNIRKKYTQVNLKMKTNLVRYIKIFQHLNQQQSEENYCFSVCKVIDMERVLIQHPKIIRDYMKWIEQEQLKLKVSLSNQASDIVKINPFSDLNFINLILSKLKKIKLEGQSFPFHSFLLLEKLNCKYIDMKGVSSISTDNIMEIIKSEDKLSNQFNMECIMELKSYINYDIISALAESRAVVNMIYIDFSNIKIQNIDDCLMDLSFTNLEQILQVKVLNLENTFVTDRGFQIISISQKFTKLQRIYYSQCRLVTERGMRFIVESTNLDSLDIELFIRQKNELIDGRILSSLKYSNSQLYLKQLNLSGSNVKDQEFDKIITELNKGKFQFKFLDLTKTPYLSSLGLVSLFTMRDLEMIFIDERRILPMSSGKTNYEQIFDEIVEGTFDSDSLCFIARSKYSKSKQKTQTKQQVATPVQNIQGDNSKKNVDSRTQANQADPHKKNQGDQTNKNQDKKMKQQQIDPKKKNLATQIIQIQSKMSFEEVDVDKQIKKSNVLMFPESLEGINFEQLSKDLSERNFFIELFFESYSKSNVKIDEFLYYHRNLINDNILYGYLLFYLKDATSEKNQLYQKLFKSKKFKYLDLSGNKSLTEKALCRFFLNFEPLKSIEKIILTNTNATNKVIDSICKSKHLSNLKLVIFENCDQISDISQAFSDVLNKISKNLDQLDSLKDFFTYFQSQFSDKNLTEYLNILKDQITSLNLKGSQSKGDFISALETKSIKHFNFEQSRLSFNSLQTLFQNNSANLITVWIDQTYELSDNLYFQPLFEMLQANKTIMKKFKFQEFLYSKGLELNKNLKNFDQVIELINSDYLDLDYFYQVSSYSFQKFLNSSELINKFKQITLTFNTESQIAIYKNITSIINIICASPNLFCFRIDQIKLQTELKIDPQLQFVEKKYLQEKLIINSNFLRHLPLKLIVSKSNDTKNKDDQQLIEKKDFIQFDTLYSNFLDQINLTELNLSSLNMRPSYFSALFKKIRKSNTLIKLSLNDLPFLYDNLFYKNFIEIDTEDHSLRPFRYIVDLEIKRTKITQRSLCLILDIQPFSYKFNIQKLIPQFEEVEEALINENNSNITTHFPLTNESFEKLTQSSYLLNIRSLDLTRFHITENLLLKSNYSCNIKKLIMDTQMISNQTFVILASTKNLPRLKSISSDGHYNFKGNLHYLFRAKYLSHKFNIPEIIQEETSVFSSQLNVQSLIDCSYMLKIKNLSFRNFNPSIRSIDQMLRVSTYLWNVEAIELTGIEDSPVNFTFWKSLAITDKMPFLVNMKIPKINCNHVHILLKSENKPRLKLLEFLEHVETDLDDMCFKLLSESPLLLNSDFLDFQELEIEKNKISAENLKLLSNSQYIKNIKKIELIETTKYNNNIDIAKQQIEISTSLYSQMMSKGNKLCNLESIVFSNNSLIDDRLIESIIKQAQEKNFSPSFSIDGFLSGIMPILANHMNQTQRNHPIIETISKIYDVEVNIKQKRHSVIHLDIYSFFNIITPKMNYEILKEAEFTFADEIIFLNEEDFLNYFPVFTDSKISKLTNLQKITIRNDIQKIQFENINRPHSLKNLELDDLNDEARQDIVENGEMKKQEEINQDNEAQNKNEQIQKKIQGYHLSLKYLMNQNSTLKYFSFSNYIYSVILYQSGESLEIVKNITDYLMLPKYQLALKEMDIIYLFLDIISEDSLASLFHAQDYFKCTKLYLLNYSQATETNTTPGSQDSTLLQDHLTNQKKIIQWLIESRIITNLQFFEFPHKISQKEFEGLIQSGVFTYNFQAFTFYEKKVEQNQDTFFPLNSYLTQQKYRKFYFKELQKLEITSKGKYIPLELYLIHEMIGLEQLIIQQDITLNDLEYIFDKVFCANPYINIEFHSLKGEIINAYIESIAQHEREGKDWILLSRFLSSKLQIIKSQQNLINQIFNFSLKYYIQNINFSPGILLTAEINQPFYLKEITLNNVSHFLKLEKFIRNCDSLINIKIQSKSEQSLVVPDVVATAGSLFILPQYINSFSNTTFLERLYNFFSNSLSYSFFLWIKDQGKNPQSEITYLSFANNKFLISNEEEKRLIQLKNQSNSIAVSQQQKKQKKILDNEGNLLQMQPNTVKEVVLPDKLMESRKESDQREIESLDNSFSQQQQPQREQLDLKDAITPEKFGQILQKFRSLRQLNLSNSSINDLHYDEIMNANCKSLEFIDVTNCEIKDLSLHIQQIPKITGFEKKKRAFQLQRFLNTIQFTASIDKRVAFVQQLVHSSFFQQRIKYLNINNIFSVNEKSVEDKLKLLKPFLHQRHNQFCITSFLLSLSNEVKNAIDDFEIEKITKCYDSIQFLSPYSFNKISYGFNFLIQQQKVEVSYRFDNESSHFLKEKQEQSDENMRQSNEKEPKLTIFQDRNSPFLSPNIDAQQTENNQIIDEENPQSIRSQKINNDDNKSQNEKAKSINLQQEIQDNKQLEDENDKPIKSKSSQKNSVVDDRNSQKENVKNTSEKNEKEVEFEMQKIEDKEDSDFNEIAEMDQDDVLNQQDISQYDSMSENKVLYFLCPEFHIFLSGISFYNLQQIIDEQESKLREKTMKNIIQYILQIFESLKNQNNKYFDAEMLKKHKILQYLFLKYLKKINQTIDLSVYKYLVEENNPSNNQEQQIDQMLDLELNDEINQDLQQKNKQINNYLRRLELYIVTLLETFKQIKTNSSYLLSFVETLDLGNNNFFNYKGFNTYVKDYMNPWFAANKNLVQQGQKKNKFQGSKDSQKQDQGLNKGQGKSINNLVQEDNDLDESLFEELVNFIKKHLQNLRVINLAGLNASDKFAENFSLILSDQSQLKNLVNLNLKNNNRLSSFGLKFFYSNIIERIPQGFSIELSYNFPEYQFLKDQCSFLEKKLSKLKSTKGQASEKQYIHESQHLAKLKIYLKQAEEDIIKQEKTQEQKSDFRSFLQNIANIGLFSSINALVMQNWKQHYLLITTMAIIFFPVSIFHLFQYFTKSINEFLNTYTFTDYISFFMCNNKQFEVTIQKDLPLLLNNQDFYFDREVSNINLLLSRKINNTDDLQNVENKQLAKCKKYIDDPSQENYLNLIKQDFTQTNHSKKNLLIYTLYFIIANLFIYQIFLTLIYPIITGYVELYGKCQTSIVVDFPVFGYFILTAFIEYFLLKKIEDVIGSEQIFVASNLQTLALMYSSTMARYDIYTDIIFAIKIYRCEDNDFQDLAIASGVIVILNFTMSILQSFYSFYDLWKISKKKQGDIQSTAYINQYTKMCFMQEYIALATVLDRFSTSSAEELPFGLFSGVKIPQVILTKFQRVFLEDLPQIIVLIIYNYRKIANKNQTFSIYHWNDISVIVTTILSLHSALTYAWHAKPSSFKTYQFNHYLEFQQNSSSQYELIITTKEKEKKFKYKQITKILEKYHKQSLQKKNLKLQENENNGAEEEERSIFLRDDISLDKSKSEISSFQSLTSKKSQPFSSESLQSIHSQASRSSKKSKQSTILKGIGYYNFLEKYNKQKEKEESHFLKKDNLIKFLLKDD